MYHTVKKGESLSLIANKHTISLNQLLSANPRFKADPDSVAVGDKLLIPGLDVSSPNNKSRTRQSNAPSATNYLIVSKGQLTFDAEGMETDGAYFSRRPHVPGAWSGITIGRGYDMKKRSADEIIEDLTIAGVPFAKAKKFARCRGLRGNKAKKFLRDNNFEALTITQAQQHRLFEIVYEELEGDVIRICSKADVVDKYGRSHWASVDEWIRDIVVDLRYRGDYTGATRERVQPLLVANNLAGMKALMADKDYWTGLRNVPVDRFNRRRKYRLS